MNEKSYAPLLPFDDTPWDNFQIYNSQKYKRDINLIDDDPMRDGYNNMIKYYRVGAESPVRIGGD